MKTKDVIFTLPALRGGGAERVVLNICELLYKKYGYQCHIILFENVIHYSINNNIKVHILREVKEVKKKGIFRFSYRRKAAKIFDEYIINNFKNGTIILSSMLFSDKVLSKSKLNVINIIHNSYTESILGETKGIKRLLKIYNINNIYRNHPVIFVSHASKKSFELSFLKPKISDVIYNPLNYEHVYQSAHVLSDANKLDRYIIHVGRFNRAKRHDRLLKSFSLVKQDVKLVLLGDGKLKNNIKNQIKALNLDDKVVMLGFHSNPYPYIKSAKCLILTSDFEGLGMVLLEAMSLNIPVLATETRDGVMNELLPENNIITPVKEINIANKIDDLLSNPDAYRAKLKDDFKEHYIAQQYHYFIQKMQKNKK